ncbi:hypothetical protein DDB_G0285147 [Dictyostelium discoideum AX4]|nr:hypothetical protein DDB_G0285147 [Dictyostelium discoideum AX4]EAL64886.1 hypothetical protein DDB_G0285147 [Dictyostelium discoideum AX4]|eukprot:XP_639864.1 hypothetical protein DDB_G0285147 [Dictyostelium discoideum AX4]
MGKLNSKISIIIGKIKKNKKKNKNFKESLSVGNLNVIQKKFY